MSDDETIVVGRIVAPHGVQGEVKMKPMVDDASFLSEADHLYLASRRGRTRYELTGSRPHKGAVLLTLAGVADRNAAEALRNFEVVVPMSWLPDLAEDEYYVAEIVGLTVEDDAGQRLGTVKQVIFTGANEVYVIEGDRHGEFLLPAIASVIQEVDLEQGKLTVKVPPGLVD